MGSVIAVASGKGGTGKTSFCANIAISLCALGEKVLLIDADAGMRSLDLVLGMTDSLLFSYGDVICGTAGLKEAAVAHPIVRNLRVLTAPGEPGIGEVYAPGDIEALLRLVRGHFTFTLVDCAAGLGADVLSFAAAADQAIIVSTSDYTALRGAQSTSGIFERIGQEKCSIVVNRVRPGMIRKGAAANIDRAMDASGLSLLGVVPEDAAVIASGNLGKVMALEHYGIAAQAYMNIARRLTGRHVRLFDQIPGREWRT